MEKELQDVMLFLEAVLKTGLLTGLIIVPVVLGLYELFRVRLYRNVKREGERQR